MSAEEKSALASELVCGALSVPINNRLSNFERLSTQYLPADMRDEIENSQAIRQEVLGISQMLLIQGLPSRKSLINQITLKNIHLVSGIPQIPVIFKLIENEESPFKISQEGPKAMAEATKLNSKLKIYEPFILKRLAVRILQKCKNFYTNLKFATIEKHLSFYGSWNKIEVLLYECNREGLVKTVLDHGNKAITFDQEVQIAENLVKFGRKLRTTFQKISEKKNLGQERNRIFMKVKEKLDEETNKVQQLKQDMMKNKEEITLDLQQEMERLSAIREKEQADKLKEFQLQKIKDE